MKNPLVKIAAATGLAFVLAVTAKALALDAATADRLDADPNPPAWGNGWLYGADLNGEFGSQANNYSLTKSGNENTGWVWTITFDVHPTLTYAKLHSGGPTQFDYLIWDDASDFAAFNASTDLSISFVQNWFKNGNGKYYGTSGLGLGGSPGGGGGGGGGSGVPDSGTTLMLLGCALLGLGVLRRKFQA